MLFQVLGLWLHLKVFLGLGLTVTEINIKKVQKQEIPRNIRNVKCLQHHKALQTPLSICACKQGSYDIIVKVNTQSLVSTSFYTTVVTREKDARRGLCILILYIIPTLFA